MGKRKKRRRRTNRQEEAAIARMRASMLAFQVKAHLSPRVSRHLRGAPNKYLREELLP